MSCVHTLCSCLAAHTCWFVALQGPRARTNKRLYNHQKTARSSYVV